MLVTNRIEVPEDKADRLKFVLDLGWQIFFKRLVTGRVRINKEASMQLHYSTILHNLGELCCVETNEIFGIELESSYGGRSRIDITCSYGDVKAAVELKCFKKESNRASDLDMYDSLKDIQRLLEFEGFQVRRFICLSNNPYYVQDNHNGHASSVSIADGAIYKARLPIKPSWMGQWKDKSRDKDIIFSKDVELKWTSDSENRWYVLNLDL